MRGPLLTNIGLRYARQRLTMSQITIIIAFIPRTRRISDRRVARPREVGGASFEFLEYAIAVSEGVPYNVASCPLDLTREISRRDTAEVPRVSRVLIHVRDCA